MKWLLTTSAFFLLTLSAYSATWFVDKDNAGVQDGTSWATAFTTIQPAIDAAFADGGGEVWVASGIYDEVRISVFHSATIDTGSLVLRDGINLFGGFVGNETMLNQRDFLNNVTTIEGSTARSGSPSYHVLVLGEGTSTLDGFTVTGGLANGPTSDTDDGGGLFGNDGGPIFLTIRNCVFIDNHVNGGGNGGAIKATRSDNELTIENSSFLNNTADQGGGAITVGGISITVAGCRFENNSTSANPGGAIRIPGGGTSVGTITNSIFENNEAAAGGAISSGAGITVTECRFINNRALTGSGGAVTVGSTSLVLESFQNCIFEGNSAAANGGGLSIGGLPPPPVFTTTTTVTNCTFWNNSAGGSGGALFNSESDVTVTNSILWNNSPDQIGQNGVTTLTVEFSDVQGGFPGTGNINAEPFFVDAANGDFRVFSGSPVIDAGTSAGAPATDIDGIARPQGAEVDMGAHESDGSLAELSAAQVGALVALTLIFVSLIVVKVKQVSRLV